MRYQVQTFVYVRLCIYIYSWSPYSCAGSAPFHFADVAFLFLHKTSSILCSSSKVLLFPHIYFALSSVNMVKPKASRFIVSINTPYWKHLLNQKLYISNIAKVFGTSIRMARHISNAARNMVVTWSRGSCWSHFLALTSRAKTESRCSFSITFVRIISTRSRHKFLLRHCVTALQRISSTCLLDFSKVSIIGTRSRITFRFLQLNSNGSLSIQFQAHWILWTFHCAAVNIVSTGSRAIFSLSKLAATACTKREFSWWIFYPSVVWIVIVRWWEIARPFLCNIFLVASRCANAPPRSFL